MAWILLQAIREVQTQGKQIDMPQEEIEIVLSRHWVSNLSVPMFLVDSEGNLIFFNEAAEPLLGLHFAEVGTMKAEDWSTTFAITDVDEGLIPQDELPLWIALNKQKPAHRRFNTVGLDNVERIVETTCFPLISRDGTMHGAIAVFWHITDVDK
jgi:PAS domain-containing protein